MVFTNSFSGCCPPNIPRLYPKDFLSMVNSRNNDVLMIIYKLSKVLRRTLQGSPENPPRFFREPSKVLQRTLQGSSENTPRFFGEHSNVLRRRLERSQEKTRTFSGEDSNVLERRLECSPKKSSCFSNYLSKGLFLTIKKRYTLHRDV